MIMFCMCVLCHVMLYWSGYVCSNSCYAMACFACCVVFGAALLILTCFCLTDIVLVADLIVLSCYG